MVPFAVPGNWITTFCSTQRRSAEQTGSRDIEGRRFTAGVADMILLKPSGGFASLCIEFKTEEKGSTQRETQKQWQKAAEAAGNKYVICRSFDDFRKEVISYLFPKK